MIKMNTGLMMIWLIIFFLLWICFLTNAHIIAFCFSLEDYSTIDSTSVYSNLRAFKMIIRNNIIFFHNIGLMANPLYYKTLYLNTCEYMAPLNPVTLCNAYSLQCIRQVAESRVVREWQESLWIFYWFSDRFYNDSQGSASSSTSSFIIVHNVYANKTLHLPTLLLIWILFFLFYNRWIKDRWE